MVQTVNILLCIVAATASAVVAAPVTGSAITALYSRGESETFSLEARAKKKKKITKAPTPEPDSKKAEPAPSQERIAPNKPLSLSEGDIEAAITKLEDGVLDIAGMLGDMHGKARLLRYERSKRLLDQEAADILAAIHRDPSQEARLTPRMKKLMKEADFLVKDLNGPI